jgi:hypothetical protein
MIKVVDKRCSECGEVIFDVVDKDVKKCDICGGKLNRIYGMHKFKEYPEGYYENFEEPDGKPVYIKDREHFWKEAKKRGLEPVGGEVVKKVKDRQRRYFS